VLDKLHRFMATPLGVVLLGIAIAIWTWTILGWGAAWRMAAVLAGLGVADMAIGWGRGLTLSEEINRDWHRNPMRYWFWLAGMVVALVLLHVHFTGV